MYALSMPPLPHSSLIQLRNDPRATGCSAWAAHLIRVTILYPFPSSVSSCWVFYRLWRSLLFPKTRCLDQGPVSRIITRPKMVVE